MYFSNSYPKKSKEREDCQLSIKQQHKNISTLSFCNNFHNSFQKEKTNKRSVYSWHFCCLCWMGRLNVWKGHWSHFKHSFGWFLSLTRPTCAYVAVCFSSHSPFSWIEWWVCFYLCPLNWGLVHCVVNSRPPINSFILTSCLLLRTCAATACLGL